MAKQQTVPPDEFVREMTKRWIETFRNVASSSLQATWRQIGEVFNDSIVSHDEPEEKEKWKVLQPATGTGKTQGAVVYCALLSSLAQKDLHPGVLIVTRLKVDADLMAEQINDLSREYGHLNGEAVVAVAHHSDSQTDLANLKNYPVLVITHRAYEMALDYLGQNGTIQQTWPLFHEWNSSTRKLVIVDECLDCVEQSEAGLDELRRTLGLIPQGIRKQFPREIGAIEIIIKVLTKMDQKAKDQPMKELMLPGDMITKGDLPDFTALRATLRKKSGGI
jgi:hypothetical protein